MESKKVKDIALAAAIMYLLIWFGFFFLIIPAFICHIIVAVECGKNKKEFDQTKYILLVVGFFVIIVRIVALFMVASRRNENIENRDNIKEVYRLKQLLDDGLITQEEFENKKKTLLI